MVDAHPIRFGAVVGRADSGAEWLSTARRMEELGFSTLLLPDTQHTPSPFPALAAAAAVTSSLRLGSWVLAAPLRSPADTVRETAALQFVSDGRFELGLGTGRPDARAEAERMGVPWGSGADRIRRLLDTVQAVRAEVHPPTPIVIAAAGPRILAAASRVADTVALALAPSAGIDEVARAADAARAEGDPEIALQLSGVGGRLVGFLARQGLDAEALHGAAGVLTGDADAMAEALLALRDRAGVTYFPVAQEHAEQAAPLVQRLTGR